jgi:hypothetical protein
MFDTYLFFFGMDDSDVIFCLIFTFFYLFIKCYDILNVSMNVTYIAKKYDINEKHKENSKNNMK